MTDRSPPADPPTFRRRDVLLGAAFATISAPVLSTASHSLTANARNKPMLRGVALAGGEFGQLIPGQYGRDYIFPSQAEVTFCAAQGFNVVRLPFKWDRLQPDLGNAFATDEWNHINRTITWAKRAGLSLILDPHNYAHRRVRDDAFTVDHLIGSERVPVMAFAAFWEELARRTKQHKHVIFGLMNEPADIAADAWRNIANDTIAAIRSTRARNLILVPGTAYTGAHSWIDAGNTVLDSLRDSENNFAIEVHQYLDADSSGRSGPALSETIGVERLQAFQAWARAQKFKAFLGEFAAGADAVSLKALAEMVREMDSNRDVWIGWTAWAAGPWWPDDEPFRLSPSRNGILPPQAKLLSQLARNRR